MEPGSPNLDLIADSKIHIHFRTWPNLACSRLSDSWGDSVFPLFIFVFSLSQFSGPNYLGGWNRLGLIRQKLCHHCTKLEQKQKNSPNAFRIRTFLFRSYSFGIETINTSIHVRSRSSLENHTRFQTKMGKMGGP